MLYQLKDGRTIQISVYEFLALSDQEINDLIGIDYGMEINNPSYGSNTKTFKKDDEPHYSEIDISDIPHQEKFDNQDHMLDDE